jgi:hypothetical protein
MLAAQAGGGTAAEYSNEHDLTMMLPRMGTQSFRDHAAFHDHERKVSYTHTFLS